MLQEIEGYLTKEVYKKLFNPESCGKFLFGISSCDECLSNAKTSLDVDEFIDEAPFSGFHVLIVLLCGFVMIVDGYDIIAMGVVLPRLSADWGMPPHVFGAGIISPLSGALIGVLIGSAIAGTMADKIGRRLTLIIMLVLAGLFMVLTPNATTLSELTFSRIITGIGAGGTIPIAIALTSEYAPKKCAISWLSLCIPGRH